MPILAKSGPIGHHIAEPTTRPIASSATTPCPSRISIAQSSGRCGHCTPIDSACSAGMSSIAIGRAVSS